MLVLLGAVLFAVALVLLVALLRGRARCHELAELARRQEEQLEHSTRLAELGEMSAAISHELHQPLTGIRNYARNAYYMLEQKPGAEEEVKNNLRLISEQVDRAAKIINEMRELTRRTDSGFTSVDLNSVIRETVEFLLPQMKLSEVTVTLELVDPLPPVRGDRVRLAQVFLNLLSNARQAMEGAGERRLVVVSRFDSVDPLPVVAEVRDTGKGFDAEQAGRLFQPFYTTRKAGHGLGLSISRAIAQDHGGSLSASGSPGAGATFTLRLPAARRGAQGRIP
ncbi:MAG TPA: ATP-binding protein [Spirochaetia bacterium]